MRKLATGLVSLLLLLLLTAFAPPVQSFLGAARPGGELSMFLRLNGVPVRMGVLTSTGTSVNNGTTASTFTVTGGLVYEVICDGSAVVAVGSTATAGDYTSSTMGVPMSTGVSRWFILRETDTSLALDTTGGTVNCVVHTMQ